MLSKEEIEFCSSLEKMFNYLKTKKKLTEFEQQVIINFDYITKKVLSDECKTATEIVAKNMYYELEKRKEEYYKKQLDQLESDKQNLIEINNKYLQKLVYALTPTKHALGDYYNNAFKKIIAENIDLETCKIKRKLKECWGIDKKF